MWILSLQVYTPLLMHSCHRRESEHELEMQAAEQQSKQQQQTDVQETPKAKNAAGEGAGDKEVGVDWLIETDRPSSWSFTSGEPHRVFSGRNTPSLFKAHV